MLAGYSLFSHIFALLSLPESPDSKKQIGKQQHRPPPAPHTHRDITLDCCLFSSLLLLQFILCSFQQILSSAILFYFHVSPIFRRQHKCIFVSLCVYTCILGRGKWQHKRKNEKSLRHTQTHTHSRTLSRCLITFPNHNYF